MKANGVEGSLVLFGAYTHVDRLFMLAVSLLGNVTEKAASPGVARRQSCEPATVTTVV